MTDTRPILLFDSGVGGLSVLAKVREALPQAPILYVADNAGFPYGTKSEAEIAARVPALLGRLAERYRPRLIVIACNTASTIALAAVRSALDLPIVGTVPQSSPLPNDREPARSACSAPMPRCASLMWTISRPGSQATVWCCATDRQSWSSLPKRRCAVSRPGTPIMRMSWPGLLDQPGEIASIRSFWPARTSRSSATDSRRQPPGRSISSMARKA
jgi:hypothetical protein